MKNFSKKRILLFIFILILLFKIFIVLSYNNSDWEPDSFMHFLELRTIFANFPQNLALGLGVWTKPLYAYPYAILIQIFNTKDLLILQISNILISLSICYLIYKIVYKVFGSFKVAVLSIFLTAFSLTFFKSSASALTDQIFAFMLVLGAYFALEKRYFLASLFFGLSVVSRIEGIFFVGIYNLYLAYELRPQYLKILKNWILSIVPLFIWNLLGYLSSGLILFVIQAGYPSTQGAYGYGGWLVYPRMFLIQETLGSFLFIVGTLFFFKNFKKLERKSYLLMIWSLFVGYVLLQVFLWKFGLFGNAGLMRYFVSVIPFMVVFEAYGALKIIEVVKANLRNFILGGLVILQMAFLFLHLSGIVFTQDFVEENPDYRTAGEWIKNNVPESEFVYADRPEVLYYAGRNLTNSANVFQPEWSLKDKGVYVWSKDWGESIFHLTSDDFKNSKVLYKIDESIYILEI